MISRCDEPAKTSLTPPSTPQPPPPPQREVDLPPPDTQHCYPFEPCPCSASEEQLATSAQQQQQQQQGEETTAAAAAAAAEKHTAGDVSLQDIHRKLGNIISDLDQPPAGDRDDDPASSQMAPPVDVASNPSLMTDSVVASSTDLLGTASDREQTADLQAGA